LAQGILGKEMGADGIIVKGNEAGGWVGEETSFILLQRVLQRLSLPVIVHGGIGLHTAPAVYACGCKGVLLDSQLALTRESRLPSVARRSIERMDGSETVCLSRAGSTFRIYHQPGTAAAALSRQLSASLPEDEWKQEIIRRVGWGDPRASVWPLGQDASFAALLAKRFKTVGGVIEAYREAIEEHVESAKRALSLGADSPLARSHGTPYPVIQGPMTRVSDSPDFALEVARAGALPFLALAVMRESQVRELLEHTNRLLGSLPWGVGLLGFVPAEIRKEQLEVILAFRPPYALIAGGRPDLASTLEEAGVRTYLHVPSCELLKQFLEQGARRFIFEGRECGGHVGPRSSFVLWNTMIDTLRESLTSTEIAHCHVLFAGGIHDGLSASAIATAAATLAEQGARIGVLIGTGYLFTHEVVTSGAIVKTFQEEALECGETVLLETGPGHATRCANTPYAEEFNREKQRLLDSGVSAEEIRRALEEFNLGRLRIASKGLKRVAGGADSHLETVSAQIQQTNGMYMIGQLAALRTSVCSIEDLHADICKGSMLRIQGLVQPKLSRRSLSLQETRPCDIAIIGMGCILPKAPNLHTYWRNILDKVDAITEIPPERWDVLTHYDADPRMPDKTYSKWGGFLDDVFFDPMRYGIPPNSLSSIDPIQLLTLEAARSALEDAGYLERPFPRERTSVILGVGGGMGELGNLYAVRSALPSLMENVPSQVYDILPKWTEDSFPGILLNVAAGRIANRFDFGGLNCTVDAACASSLSAIYLAAKELETGTSDMVLAGGADTMQNAFAYLCFSKTQALSPHGRCRTFDQSADGIAISEGLAIIVLKRLADAEADGDRIYAVLKGIGSSSDGQDRGLTAPRPEGQALAIRRAYRKACVSPQTIGLIEAHGTGTVAGDRAELEALKTVFSESGCGRQSCAVGSVKSMIGHTKCAAGVAGVVKVALALHHKLLPPTLHVQQPNTQAKFSDSPFYINSEPRPWLKTNETFPRRAGVSAFGFGGTNFHAVLEEYVADPGGEFDSCPREQPCELFAWGAQTQNDLFAAIEEVRQALSAVSTDAVHLGDLAYTLWQHRKQERTSEPKVRLAVIATTVEDLIRKLDQFVTSSSSEDSTGIYFGNSVGDVGKIAFLFPGQGSQLPGMLSELAMRFAEVRKSFETADRVLGDRFPGHLIPIVFPTPPFTVEEAQACAETLKKVEIAQPALGAAGMACLSLLRSFGIEPDCVAGHSYGEYVALCAAGIFSEEQLYLLSEARGRAIKEGQGLEPGTMAVVFDCLESVSAVIHSIPGVWVANVNAPRQVVISGTNLGVEEATKFLTRKSIEVQRIPVACAFHSPLVEGAAGGLRVVLGQVSMRPPKLPVYSNETGLPYQTDLNSIVSQLSSHLTHPVYFAEEIRNMYRNGVRIFVEAGPRSVLTGLVDQILSVEPHIALSISGGARSELIGLHHTLGELFAHGVPINFEPLFARRPLQTAAIADVGSAALSPTCWIVNGARARPYIQEVRTAQCIPGQTKPAVSLRARPCRAEQVPPRTEMHEHMTESSSPSEIEKAMLRHHELMARLVETDERIMLAYLAGGNGHERTSPIALGAASEGNRSENVWDGENLEITGSQRPVIPNVQNRENPSFENNLNTHQEDFTQKLLQIASERTGYPKDLLGLDRDVVADLGIDSIKWVEILGAYLNAVARNKTKISGAGVEGLASLKTLRSVAEAVERDSRESSDRSAVTNLPIAADGNAPSRRELMTFDNSTNGDPKAALETIDSASDSVGGDDCRAQVIYSVDHLSRHIPTTIETRIPPCPAYLASTQALLITDDEEGISEALALKIRKLGGSVVIVRFRKGFKQVSDEEYEVDLADPDATSRFIDHVGRDIPIGGILHLAPLSLSRAFSEIDMEEWRRRLNKNVMAFCNLLKSASRYIRNQHPFKGVVLAATRLGGSFGIEDSPICPSCGGVSGIVKTIASEWSDIRARVVDFSYETVDWISDRLLAEIVCEDAEVEVGYSWGRRVGIRLIAKPYAAQREVPILDTKSIVLVTGGGRGITAEATLELAARYHPKLIIVGRTAVPTSDEPDPFTHLKTRDEVRAAFVERARRSTCSISISRLEAEVADCFHKREIQTNLDLMKRAGAEVHYHQVDVRNEVEFSAFVDSVYADHGRIDCVIHGAGIIDDNLLVNKNPDSFRRVLDTKAVSAFVLSRKLRAESLKLFVLFSSMTARFGNRGQSDYAAANEILNKIAQILNRCWQSRVVALNWGPWQKAGMVTRATAEQFRDRGIGLISPKAGRHALYQELMHADKDGAEVILGTLPTDTAIAVKNVTSRNKEDFPFFKNIELGKGNGEAVECKYRLSTEELLFLKDHLLDGQPVLPVAAAAALMAEFVQKAYQPKIVTAVRNFRVLKGIVIDGKELVIHMVAKPRNQRSLKCKLLDVEVEICRHIADTSPFYRATVEFADQLPEAPVFAPIVVTNADEYLPSAEDAYRQYLFHGGLMQCIASFEAIGPEGITGVLLPSAPSRCIVGGDGRWLIDPVLLDGAPQLAIVWSRLHLGATVLPSAFRAFQRYAESDASTIRCYLSTESTASDTTVLANVYFASMEGQLLATLEGLEGTVSKSLNRLAGVQFAQEPAQR
jgi:acyl transferase domain-containing protein/NAD(P)H-dependent flavin oxidoreductase YrpB (nitropropane dioxygenase family)/NAD(P)-dependent dehydrogenase (short-subunit alcohol dehydrogenase family)